MSGLTKHKLAQHPQLTMMTDKEITHQFRNNNISITRIHKETNAVPSVINHNPSPFRKTTTSTAQSINARRAEVKMMKSAEGHGRMKVPARGDARIKVGASATIESLVMSSLEVDDDTTDWQKWTPVHREREIVSPEGGGNINIITASVAERATSAFRITPEARAGTKGMKQAPQAQARKSVPPMYRISDVAAPKNGKRPTTSVSAISTAQRTPAAGLRAAAPAGNSSAVAGIMKNLGKMKSMNQAATSRPNPKVISLASRPPVAPPPKKSPLPVVQQVSAQPYRVSKPPQVSKSKGKIMPRNAFNNALPKPGVGMGQPRPPHLENEQDFDDGLNEEEYAFINPPELVEEPPQLSPPKPSPTASIPQKSQNGNGAKAAGGKIVAPKSLSSNRFNPIDAKSKSTPPPPAATTARNGNSVKASNNSPVTTSGKTNGKQQPTKVIAKKSTPKKKNSAAEENEIFKKIKKHVPNMPGTDYDMPRLDAVGTYSTQAGSQVWVCLVCEEQEQEQSSRDMICCDGCEDWYHWGCVGITKSFPEDQPWFCKRCIFNYSKNPAKDFPKLFSNAKR
ncbi:Transcription initiation factor TFIID subunit 3 [Orchesella cincta]|uniref:Transcription initiation factor TFIID subunit 3 n=1 Tax=Orchesella cincta TaxID=48709 RepID=A0A1D2MPC5_ORCCI|nr:Transcription initiation factor TFIID subunit 3 [Orchesella cincta]